VWVAQLCCDVEAKVLEEIIFGLAEKSREVLFVFVLAKCKK